MKRGRRVDAASWMFTEVGRGCGGFDHPPYHLKLGGRHKVPMIFSVADSVTMPSANGFFLPSPTLSEY